MIALHVIILVVCVALLIFFCWLSSPSRYVLKKPLFHGKPYEWPIFNADRQSCLSNTVYSMSDVHCNKLCSERNMSSINGVCKYDVRSTLTDCDPHQGFTRILTGNPEFGTVSELCLSADPGIRPEDPKLPNLMCVNGKIDIDYLKKFPMPDDCVCGEDLKLTIIPASGEVRERAVCMPVQVRPRVEVDQGELKLSEYLKAHTL